jgi:geranylgeranyl pyrophosphate synthase
MPNVALDTLGVARAQVDAALESLCDGGLTDTAPRVAEAIRYSLLGEGKRLRALLVIETYRAAGGDADASRLAAAVEIVHAYSLVHDDLPCMDNDSVRRGRPTVHRVFGVGAATAAGVAMVPLAARAAYLEARALGLSAGLAGDVVRELMVASGAGGMIGGQLLDLLAEGQRLTLEELERVHRSKTGMLIAASARIGAMAAQCDRRSLEVFARYGEALGLAFQIADDVLDVTSTTDQLGKTAGRDLALQKNTYPRLLGVADALERARVLADQACDILRAAGRLTPALEGLARYVVERKS